jgi:translation initiation factor IF-3
VKITIMFRGREVTHPERGQQLLDRLAEELQDLAIVEQRPNLDGRNMTMMLGPSKAILSGQLDADADGAAAAEGEAAPGDGEVAPVADGNGSAPNGDAPPAAEAPAAGDEPTPAAEPEVPAAASEAPAAADREAPAAEPQPAAADVRRAGDDAPAARPPAA